MSYGRLSDQWDNEADEAIKEPERRQGREFTEPERVVFRKRGEHRSVILDGSRWGDVKAASTNIGEVFNQPQTTRPVVEENLTFRHTSRLGSSARLSSPQRGGLSAPSAAGT
jgi:hypothetical protein